MITPEISGPKASCIGTNPSSTAPSALNEVEVTGLNKLLFGQLAAAYRPL